MTEPSIIILCAGKQTRWQFPNGRRPIEYPSKHFISIWGEPLIKRMVRQLPIMPWVIGNTTELLSLNECAGFNPDPTPNKSYSILSHDGLWGSRTIILLGDVLFSDKTLADILNCADDVAFFGRDSEMFAFVFSDDYAERMKQHLYEASKLGGSLWDLYRVVCGFEPGSPQKEKVILHELTDDKLTRDFDHPSQYEQFCKEFPNPV